MVAVGGALEAALLPGFQAILAHQPGGPTATDLQSLILQLAGHAWTAVGPIREGEGRADVGQQNEILPLARAGCWTRSPGKVAAGAHFENLTQTGDGEVLFRRIDEPELHRLPSLAKKAVAFFRISLSWRKISFSRHSRFSSAAVSSCRSSGGSSISRSRRRSSQWRRVDRPTPRSAATSRRLRPLVRASRTASSRNSFVKRVWGMEILLGYKSALHSSEARPELSAHPPHLPGMGIAADLHGGAFGQTRVGLPQREAVPLGLAHQSLQGLEIELRVGGMGDGLGLHRGVDADPLQA